MAQMERRGDRGDRQPEIGVALPLPQKTAARIEGHGPGEQDNLGLWLDKLVLRCLTGEQRFDKKALEALKQARDRALKSLCGEEWHSRAGRDAHERMRQTVVALHGRGQCRSVRATVSGRLLIDHGRAQAAEASVSFHSIWGVPRIAGSALKGAVRSSLSGMGTDDEEALFGSQQRAGQIVFYEALPVDGRFRLAMDVLTPHYKDYYTGSKPPAEYFSPVPVTFVTVVATQFEFFLGTDLLADRTQDPELGKAMLDKAADALRQVLTEEGIGSKTSSGYGRFELV